MKVKSINLFFENCEMIKLTTDMFKYLIIEGIKKNKSINCYQYADGETQDMLSCDYFSIEINKKGLNQNCWKTKLKERLEKNDLVGISIENEDNTQEEIYVLWGNHDFANEYQKNYFEKDKVKIVIERTNNE